MFFHYVRLALRSARRRPLFLVVTAASLAVGVATVTTVFAGVSTVYVRPIPGVQQPRRVVELGLTDRGSSFAPWDFPDFLDLRERASLLEHTAFYVLDGVTLWDNESAERLRAVYSTSGYFETVGANPILGRTFARLEDFGPGQHPVVIVSHAYWQEHFAGSGDVLGATLRLNDAIHTVIGVAAPGFRGLSFGVSPDVYLPLMQHPMVQRAPGDQLTDRAVAWGRVVGRMDEGVELPELNISLEVVFGNLRAEFPQTKETRSARAVRLSVIPTEGAGATAVATVVLAALALLVLAATCANVGGMVLARAASRPRETAIRLALGAGRTRAVMPMISDVILVFLLGGAGGVLFTAWLVELDPNLLISTPRPLPSDFRLELGWSVPAFGLILTLLIGVLFGVLPALRGVPTKLVDALREQAGTMSHRGSRLRRIFVGGQVGVSFLLLTSASLFLRSLQQVRDSRPSVELEGIYLTPVDLDIERYETAQEVGQLVERILSGVREIPEVAEAAVATDFPVDNQRMIAGVWPGGRSAGSGGGIRSNLTKVAPGYFEMSGISLLAGRTLGSQDRFGSPRVVLVNEEFASRAWPGASPLGKTVDFGREDEGQYTIVGVVENTRAKGLMDALEPQVFTALAQDYATEVRLGVRPRGGAEGFAGSVRETILSVDPSLTPDPTRSLAAFSADQLVPNRVLATVGSSLGLIVLLLSVIGIHGVVVLSVVQRTREVGVRMALGSTRLQVVLSVVTGGAVLALPGLIAGAVLGVALGYLLRSTLFGVSPLDPIALGSVVMVFLGIIALACVMPARRAASIQPAEALRAD